MTGFVPAHIFGTRVECSHVAGTIRTATLKLKDALFSIVVMFGLLHSSAYGYVGTPTLATPNPVAGQPIRVSVPIGDCDGYFALDPPPLFVRNGQTIRVDFTTREIGFCIFPQQMWTFPVGSYEQGAYQIQVYETHIFMFSGFPPVTTLRATIPINVAAGTPVSTPVPAGGSVWWAALISLLVLAVSFHLRIGGSVFATSATTLRTTRR